MLQRDDVRLVTLLGPGGVGKTRVALHVAAEIAREHPGRVRYVFLAATRDPHLVIAAIAQACGIRETTEKAMRAHLTRALETGEHLLVIDNFEQVIDAATELSCLLRACPGLRIIVTSRVRLDVYGEHIFTIQPFQDQAESVQLFIDRARANNIHFQVDDTARQEIEDICARLDGLPLAIELAAARLNVYSLSELTSRLDPRLPELTSTARDLPDRLRTMSNAIRWSYDLLQPVNQDVFRRLSVFQNGCRVDAAVSMMAPEIPDAEEVMERCSHIASSSLMIRSEDADGERRYRMLETIREFGIAQLAANDDLVETRNRHAAHMAAFAEQGLYGMNSLDQAVWIERLDADRANIEAAMAWTLESGDKRTAILIANGMWLYWDTRGQSNHGVEWLKRVLALKKDIPPDFEANGYYVLSIIALHTGDNKLAYHAATQALAYAEIDRSPWPMAMSHFAQGMVANARRDWNTADRALIEARKWFQSLAFPVGEAAVLNDHGRTAYLMRDATTARARFEEALAIGREINSPRTIALALHNLGNLATDRRDYTRAAEQHIECMTINLAHGDEWHIMLPLIGLIRIATETGRSTLAARLTGAAESLLAMPGGSLWDWRIPEEYARTLESTRDLLGGEGARELIDEGREMSPEDAIEAARELTLGTRASDNDTGLTGRELDVLDLLVVGKSDRDIGESLSISYRTVQTHTRRIFRKLGVHSRTEAIAEAHRRGIA